MRRPRDTAGVLCYHHRVETGLDLKITMRLSSPADGDWLAEDESFDQYGEGDSPAAAIADLGRATDDYIRFLRDNRARIAPGLARHLELART